jgi:UDP-N-acetylglucosamine 2-epimerase
MRMDEAKFTTSRDRCQPPLEQAASHDRFQFTMAQCDIALCYGTRPQIIKASELRRALAGYGRVLAVDTGQHYDFELNALLYEQLDVRPPDLYLDVGSAGHAEQTAAVLVRAEAALREARPRAVIVIGDTNSTLGCALAAVKLRIPVVHVEAGLRARDALMAEEINRRMVDAVSQVLCTPSARASERLAAERPDGVVRQTGDVAYDVLLRQAAKVVHPSTVAPVADGEPYCYATLHRAELTDDPDRLAGVLEALAALGRTVVLPLHPRTRAVLDRHQAGRDYGPAVRVLPPVGYLESLALGRCAELVVTDSGGVQREAYWNGIPCVTLRGETEWLETVEIGANALASPAAPERLAGVIEAQRARWPKGGSWDRTLYGRGDAAAQIADAVGALVAA